MFVLDTSIDVGVVYHYLKGVSMNASKTKILCVDDERDNLDLLEGLLVSQGYEVVMAESGSDALKQIADQKFDLVLLDVLMPEIDGFEVCRKIKDNKQYRRIPVVMITALTSKEDRIKSIEAGAEDFISKPFDSTEVLARIRMLLKFKDLNHRLNSAYDAITNIVGFDEAIAMSFDPKNADFLVRTNGIINNILRRRPDISDRAEVVIVGYVDLNNIWQWYKFDSVLRDLHCAWLKTDLSQDLHISPSSTMQFFHINEEELGTSAYRSFIERMKSMSIPVSNMLCFLSKTFCIVALNFEKHLSHYDAELMNSIVMQNLYFHSLSSRIKETEEAFNNVVLSLARAAEANDQNSGNHILRVGEYCATIARRLGMSEKFCNIIRVQAALHDVGNIFIRPDILRNPGKLSPEEFEEIKKHPLTGSEILGNHGWLTIAKNVAISHHEKWDGSGYPYGLRGEEIPLEGRILNIADQYDVLRNKRVYKPRYDHQEAFKIITEGNGRTLPHHFDPRVLRVFRETASQFEKIYERLNG